MAVQYTDIPELVTSVREQASRCVDAVVTRSDLKAAIVKTLRGPNDAVFHLGLTFPLDGVGNVSARLEPSAIGQVCSRTGSEGRQLLPAAYAATLLGVNSDRAADLARENLQFWLDSGRDKPTRDMIRLIGDTPLIDQNGLFIAPPGTDIAARAFVSDAYLPIDNLPILHTILQVLTGALEFREGVENYARGARALRWALSPTNLRLGLLNPEMVFDLRHPELGIQRGESAETAAQRLEHVWLRGTPKRAIKHDDGGSHYVFPMAWVQNSETGHGGTSVRGGLYEAACKNGSAIGKDLIRRHTSARNDVNNLESQQTRQRRLQLTLSEIADAVRMVFEPQAFETACRKFAGLFDMQITELRPVVETCLKYAGITEGVVDSILTSYSRMHADRDTLGDVQRAITSAAQKQESDALWHEMEALGGAIIERGPAILAS